LPALPEGANLPDLGGPAHIRLEKQPFPGAEAGIIH
jgi:hypothetical protein